MKKEQATAETTQLKKKKSKAMNKTKKNMKEKAANPRIKSKNSKNFGAKKNETELCRIIVKNLPKSVTEKHIKDTCLSASVTPLDIQLNKERRFVFLGFETPSITSKALVALNNSYLLNCCIKAEYCYKLDKSTTDEVKKIEESILDTGRLFIRNLHFNVTEDDFKALFEPYGDIEEMNVCWDRNQQRNKGFGFVSFVFPSDAVKAYKALDKTTFKGRYLHVCPGQDKPEDTRPKSFKDEQEEKLKKDSSKGHNWNSLFLGADAVAEIMSSNLGISKAELLKTKLGKSSSRAGSSIAVTQAMAETELVLQTKEFLEKAGIQLDILENHCRKPSSKRSNCVFLAKNLPAGTKPTDLRERFEKYGAIRRLVLPPAGVTAVLEFEVPQEAKVAYRKEAYSRIKDRPLLLEWAPESLIDPTAPDLSSPKTDSEVVEDVDTEEQEAEEEEEEEEEEGDGEKAANIDNKLLVRNIAFQATRAEVSALFRPFGECRVRLPVKPGSSSEEGQHRGFCFVEYITRRAAQRAMSQLGVSTHLYGRRLVIVSYWHFRL